MQATIHERPEIASKTVLKNGFKLHQKAPSLSLEAFKRRYLDKKDGFKYEWSNGEVIKTKREMNQAQQFIWLNFKFFLEKLRLKNPEIGEFLVECDSSFAGAFRRPDIAWFSKNQLPKLGDGDQVPRFVIEIISSNDQLNKANLKLADYRRAGVEIVWFIFPKTNEIHIYRGKNMTICLENDPCSAEPVIEGFVLPASDVFKKLT